MIRLAEKEAIPVLEQAETWQELHQLLAEKGYRYERKGWGAILIGRHNDREFVIKPSSLARWASLKNMEKRLGNYESPIISNTDRQTEPAASDFENSIFQKYEDEKARLKSAYKAVLNEVIENSEDKRALTRQEMILREKAKAKIAKNKKLIMPASDFEAWLKIKNIDINIEPDNKIIIPNPEKPHHNLPTKISLFKQYHNALNADRYRVTCKREESSLELKIKNLEREINNEDIKKQLKIMRFKVAKIDGKAHWIELTGNNTGEFNLLSQKIKQYFNNLYNFINTINNSNIDLLNEKINGIQLNLNNAMQKLNINPSIIDRMIKNNTDNVARVLDRDADGLSKGYTPEQVINNMQYMTKFELGREHLYFTPLSDDKHHFFIDDIDRETLIKLKTLGINPNVIIESSENNYQALFTIDKMGSEYEHQIINNLATSLNRSFGDINFCGSIHPHRIPGFFNVKPSHRQKNGGYFISRIVEVNPEQCALFKEFMTFQDSYYKWKSINKKPINKQPINTTDALNYDFENPDVGCRIFLAYRANIMEFLHIAEGEQDNSKMDYMIALRLRATGHPQEEIERIILTANEQAGRSNKYDLGYYAQLVAESVFKPEAELKLNDLEKSIPFWRRLEKSAIIDKSKDEYTAPAFNP